jgi:methyl-accepting chemotaxis protein
MASNVATAANANRSISSASQEQQNQFAVLQSTLQTLFAVLRESGTKVEATAIIGDELRTVAERLNKMISGFAFHGDSRIEQEQDERRRFPRAQNSLRVRVTQNGMTVEAITSDFSMTGMRLKLAQPLTEQAPADLLLFLPNEDVAQYERQEGLRLKARTVWQSGDHGKYLCGVQFLDLAPAAQQQLRECFAFFRKNHEFPSA